MNTGKKYEILTQIIFNQIVNQNSVETINVQRDVTLQGIVSSHQIDVYWEFKHADYIIQLSNAKIGIILLSKRICLRLIRYYKTYPINQEELWLQKPAIKKGH